VVPFPVDFQGSSRGRMTILSFVPSAASLNGTERALREIYGRLFYTLRYYLEPGRPAKHSVKTLSERCAR
jgi:hypothetical protein